MAVPVTLTGAMIIVHINNKRYKVAQSVQFTVDYGSQEIYGIDSHFAQEIATTRVSVRGSIQGLRLKYSGGLQAGNLRPLWNDIAASPYISIRIQDRSTGEDILFVPQATVIRESHAAATKTTYKMNFEFAGIVPYFALDRA